MKLPAYPRYKPSGVAWLGDVPEHWEAKRLKYSASINDEALPETTDPAFEMSYVDISCVDAIRGIGTVEDMVFEVAPSRARRVVRDGDTIVSTVRTYLRAIAPVRGPATGTIVSTGFAVVRPRRLSPTFMSYALREAGFVEAIVARSVGVSYPAVNASEIGALPIPLPTVDEQRAIADFLDRATAKIDTLVAKKRTLIERLQEKRTALISRTVTRGLPPAAARAAGLDPHPRLRPSGTAWIGDVPEHWDVEKIKYVAKVESGHTPARSVEEYWANCTIPWVSLNDSGFLREHDYISDTFYQISELGIANSSARLLPPQAVVFSRDATVGLCAITTKPMAVSQHFVAYLCGPRIIPEYLLLSLKAMRQHLEGLSLGATISTIGMADVRSLVCPLPPIPEQREVIAFLDRETAKLDALAAKVETAIERLQEYRTALITAAVTGKVDVRRAVA
jgi:type I restriction enzyme S subunit